ncbi:unnamed protein product [Calypogeia fissa]
MSSNPENGVPKPESPPALEVSAVADDSIDAGNARVADTVVPMPASQIGEEIGGLEREELEQSDAEEFDVIKVARRRCAHLEWEEEHNDLQNEMDLEYQAADQWTESDFDFD